MLVYFSKTSAVQSKQRIYCRTSLLDEAGEIVADVETGVGDGEGEVMAGEAVPGMHCQ